MAVQLLRLKVITPVVVLTAVAGAGAFLADALLIWLAAVQLLTLTAVLLLGRRWLLQDRRLRAERDRLARTLSQLDSRRHLAELTVGLSQLAARCDQIHDALAGYAEAAKLQLSELDARVDPLHQAIAEVKPQVVEMVVGKVVEKVRVDIRREREQIDAVLGLYHDVKPALSLPTTGNWAASADLLRYLFQLVRDGEHVGIVECGSGVSTLIMAYALRDKGKGRIVSLDHDAGYAAQTRRLLAEHGLSEWAQIHHAPLTDVTLDGETWPWYDLSTLDGAEPFDLLVVDGPPALTRKQARYPAIPLLRDRLSGDAVVVLDDYDRPDERQVGERWLKLLPGARAERINHQKGTWVLRLENL